MAQALAIRISNDSRIVMRLASALKNTDGPHHAQFLRKGCKSRHRWMPIQLMRLAEKPGVLLNAEIIPVEQFLQQDQLGALACRITRQCLGPIAIFLPVMD